MLTMKRKITEEKDRYGRFDNVIEVDDVKSKSYNAHETETAENLHYTTREAYARPKTEIMPKIKNETKARVDKKDAVSTKTKVLLVSYLAVAVILAAVVIGTGVAISNASGRAADLNNQIKESYLILDQQHDTLLLLNSDDAIAGRAVNDLDMQKIDPSEVIEVQLAQLGDPIVYSRSTNWFDKLCQFISSIFS